MSQTGYLLDTDVLLFDSPSTEGEEEPLVEEQLPQRRTTTAKRSTKIGASQLGHLPRENSTL
jgi:hypothetical protein